MGGKGKKGISQIAKRQERAMKEAAQKQKKEGQKAAEKKEKQTVAFISDQIINNIKNELKSYPYISPWLISSKYGITMGDAKRILQSFEREGLIKYVYKSSRNPILAAS